MEGYYILKDGKKLRFGYTTGTCAAAAAKAAVKMLLTGRAPETVHIMTPKGIALDLAVLEPELSDGAASCAIRKYSGDDPDVTNGILVYAEARLSTEQGIKVDGGLGVGRVTKPGLKEPVGEAAINPVPREMIRQAAEEALDECGEMTGLSIVISVPEGVEIAKKTFNPRLGIVGGISILGTSGIVEPMSEEAMVESIELEIRQKHALGEERLIISPGNYGADFAKAVCELDETRLVKCSNYIGRTLDMAITEGYKEVLLIGQIGKLVKLSGGIMNTHSREGDGRAELMAAWALRAGADADLARAVLDCVTTEEMLRILHDAGLMERAMAVMGERIAFYLEHRVKGQITVGCVVFHENYGMLCSTGPALEWIEDMRKHK
ncbi:MAG: cobalamin biosynthesis protein CbiD [Lachnospiraceae bacterium]|nr:cobalamin biosynthesis protein CbiD [Lachnospiraceae bacterium]